MIGYQRLWTEQKSKLNKSISELRTKRNESIIAVEKERMNHKLKGLIEAYDSMLKIEVAHGICEHENEILLGDRRMYCPDCNKEYFDASI